MSETTAYHEAGHVFMALCQGARVRLTTIDPDWDDGPERYGDTQVEWPRSRFSDREFAEKRVLVALAGPVAEMIFRGEPWHPGLVAEWAGDWAEAWEAAAGVHSGERGRMAFLEQAAIQLYRTLDRDDHWAALAVIVDHLLAHETLEGEQVEEILADWFA